MQIDSFSILPQEIQAQIFSFLPADKLKVAALVCKIFQTLADECKIAIINQSYCSGIRSLKLQGESLTELFGRKSASLKCFKSVHPQNDNFIPSLKSLPELSQPRKLTLNCFGTKLKSLALCHFEGLTKLNLERNNLTSSEINSFCHLCQLTKLQELKLSSNQLFASDFQELLKRLSNLRRLSLCGNFIEGHQLDWLENIEQPVNLTWLDLGGNKLGSQGLSYILFNRAMANLEYLNVEHNKIKAMSQLSLKGLPVCLTALKSLNLRENRITDPEIKWMLDDWPIDGLTELNLAYMQCYDQGIKAIAECSKLTSLTFLDLSGNILSPPFWEPFCSSTHLTNLSCLFLSGCGLDDSHIQSLVRCSSFPNLTALDLTENQIQNSGLQHLGQTAFLTNLLHLSLFGCGIEGQGIHHLTRMNSHLISLDLSCNNLKDLSALKHLTHLSNLQMLDLSRCELNSSGASYLGEIDFMTSLTVLNLEDNALGDNVAHWNFYNWRSLKKLILKNCGLEESSIACIASSADLTQLQTLDIRFNSGDKNNFNEMFSCSPSWNYCKVEL